MRAFKAFKGLVAPLDKANVDTDQIIPKQFLKAIVRSGLGKGLFFDWRFLPDGADNPDFARDFAGDFAVFRQPAAHRRQQPNFIALTQHAVQS